MSHTLLNQLTDAVQSRFQKARTLLSFAEYLDVVYQQPTLHCRNAAQYIADAFQYFGKTSEKTHLGTRTRYKLFDGVLQDSQFYPQVVGQELPQQQIQRLLSNFVREGRATRLILLHGPNGSGKSSLIQSLIQALEHYSTLEEGIIYRFNWIFPAEKLKRSGIGFGRQEDSPALDLHSYAHLEGDQVEARLTGPMKDHPLLLLPAPERKQWLQQLYRDEKLPTSFPLSEYLQDGDLDPRNRVIFDALLAHYSGNFAEVLRHVQIERYYISQRYRTSAVTVEPQMHVDAGLRQVTADRSMSSLPKPLHTLNLYEPVGALIDANRGIMEFSDLLKRPLETFKYLLGTCETGRVSVEPLIFFLDLVLVGTANEQNLDQFKKSHEFTSFKSRIELIKVPYLLQYSTEQLIYDDLLQRSPPAKPIAPHTTELAALWAVLTRMHKPDKEHLPEKVAPLVLSFTPLEKAKWYNDGQLPKRFSGEEIKQLRHHLPLLYLENQNNEDYEGQWGASPREIRTVLLNAAQLSDYPCLSPLALFDELERLVQERSVYRFLQIEPEDSYYDADEFINIARKEHLDIIDHEFRQASGLIQPDQYIQLLRRYVQHVKAYLRKEKVQNPVTMTAEEPNKKMMESVETILLSPGENAEQFRNDLFNKIAVQSLNHPKEELDLATLFADYIDRLEQDAFSKQYKRLQRIAKHCVILLSDPKPNLKADEHKEAEDTLQAMLQLGYTKEGVREQIALLLHKRYSAS